MLVVVLACFALGLAAQRAAPGSRALVRWLDDAVIVVALPALILAELPELALGADLVVPVAAAWACLALAAASVGIGARRHGWPRATTGALLLVTPLGNTTFLGLPMVEALLGTDAIPRALAFDQLGTFVGLTTYGAVVAARWGEGEAGWRPVLRRLTTFPPLLAVVASSVLRIVEVPEVVDGLLGGVGRLVSPLAMLALGLRFRLTSAPSRQQAARWCLATKMGLLPLAVLTAAVLVGGRHHAAWQASVLEAGMPPMVTAGVVAARAGLDEELATTVIGAGLLLALVSVPLLGTLG